MVLASTPDITNLKNLAHLADKVVEVVALSISGVNATHLSSKIEQLPAEVTRLMEVIESLPLATVKSNHTRSRSLAHILH